MTKRFLIISAALITLSGVCGFCVGGVVYLDDARVNCSDVQSYLPGPINCRVSK